MEGKTMNVCVTGNIFVIKVYLKNLIQQIFIKL